MTADRPPEQVIREALEVGHAARPSEQRAALAALAVLLAEREEREQRIVELEASPHERWWRKSQARAVAAEAERDEARNANHRLMRLNGGLRGKASDEPDDHFCAVEGCMNEPTLYEFPSDEFVCDEHVYYGATNPLQADLAHAEAELVTLRAAGYDFLAVHDHARGTEEGKFTGPYFNALEALRRAVLAGGQRDAECVCGEINTRHCPVHAGDSGPALRRDSR